VAERPRLEAVLFDAGGTLVRLDFEWMSELLRSYGLIIAPGTLRRAEVAGRRRYDASFTAEARQPNPDEPHPLGSRGDTRAYFAGMLEAAGVPGEHIEPALLAFAERHRMTGLWTRPIEGAREALDRILELGLRAACVSNSDGRAEMHLRDCGVRDGLEFVVDSQVVGVEKPDPAIFAFALERLSTPADRALYVGDIVSVDAAGAAAAGLHAVLIDPAGDYAPAGVPAIPAIAELPTWIEQRFERVAPATGRAR
jgi:putative hydrolase of the HAD superfamily